MRQKRASKWSPPRRSSGVSADLLFIRLSTALALGTPGGHIFDNTSHARLRDQHSLHPPILHSAPTSLDCDENELIEWASLTSLVKDRGG